MYDVIVIGTGGVGSATLYELARRGASVLGLDRFPAGHDRGSSHGQTRIIRRSYFEHVDYVPLLNLAYRLWDDFCQSANQELLQRTGLVYIGNADDQVMKGVLSSAKQHELDVRQLARQEATERFPGFVVPAESIALWEPDAGYVWVEQAVKAFVQEAIRLGADTVDHGAVRQWSATPHGVVVETTEGRFEGKRLIIAAGCWAGSLLAELNLPLRVVRKHLHWRKVRDRRYRQAQGCPCFLYSLAGDAVFYGFPDTGHRLKVAEHSGGTVISDPLVDKRTPEPKDTQRITSLLRTYLPGVSSAQLRHEVCYYTMTPDGHFIVDRHPDHDHVWFAAGLSGHGFKFVPALGRILTQLTLDSRCDTPIAFLGLDRLRR